MIQFDKMRQYTHVVDGVRFKQDVKKPFLLVYLSENSTFFDDYKDLNIRKVDARYLVVPLTKIPRTRLTPEDRALSKSFGLQAFLSTQKVPAGKNIIYDLSNYLTAIDTTYEPSHYRQRAGFLIRNLILKVFQSYPDNYQKVLIYSVNASKDINSFASRKIFPLILQLKEDPLVYDHMLMNVVSQGISTYRLLIKDREYDFNRIKILTKNVKLVSTEEEQEEEISNATKSVMKKIEKDISPSNIGKVKDAIKTFLRKDEDAFGKASSGKLSGDDGKEIATASILHKTSGDVVRAKIGAKAVTAKNKSKILKAVDKRYADELLTPKKPQVMSNDVMVENSNIAKAVDNKSPEHLFEKRQVDFETNLRKDMTNSFKVLESKEVPLKVKSMNITVKPQKDGEIDKSDISVLKVVLTDDFKNTHEVFIDIPNIGADGTFNINGRRKCLINQIVLCPITFPKPYDSKFESSYSAFHIHSKRTKRESYLDIYMASYKLPLLLLLSFSFGFERSLKAFKIKHKITKEAPSKDVEFFTKINDEEYVILEGAESELQKELCQSFIRNDFSQHQSDSEFGTKGYFNDVIISITGRVNSTFLIQSNLENIVDPVAKQVLINKQLPYDLEQIMHYMAAKVVTGFTQSRNDISNQRIRNSEIVVHLAQKQILAAYTEYKEKVLSGNEEAQFSIPQSKVMSEFVNSEIVTDMEFANPIEEMASMTRVSPIGKSIGGIPDKGGITMEGRDVHPSMYGNIDPLDTSESENVGISQHLTVDAYITSARGLFLEKEMKEGENSGLLSTTTCMIPFIENDDGARVMFGANQSRQAVPLKNPEPPIVQSGYESLLTNSLSDVFIKKAPCSGKITKITGDDITVTCTNGKKNVIDITPVHLKSGSGKDTLSVFKPNIKEGQAIKSGSIVAEGSSISGGSISLGRTLCVALMPYKGYNFEDGIVISESVMKEEKLASLHGIVEEVLLSKEDRLMEIASIGDVTKKGQPILRKTVGEIEQLLGIEDEIEGEDVYGGQFIKKSPGGTIVDIEVFRNVPDSVFPKLKELSDRTAKKYKKPPKEKFTQRGTTIKGVLIRFKIEQTLNVGIGDKLTNRHGAKGIISLIEKDELMPVTPWGDKVDIICNPIGVVNRMNMGQFYELYSGLISKEMAKRVIASPSKASVITLMKSVLPKLYAKNKDFASGIIKNFMALSAAKFKLFTEQVKATGNFTLLIPPFKAPAYKEILSAMKVLNLKSGYNLKLPEYNTKTKELVPVGYTYFVKLEHIGSEKLHARSTGPMTGKAQQPTAGKKKDGGQRMGELDTYSLISYNCPLILAEFFGPLSDDQGTKNEIIADIINSGNAEYRPAKVTPGKDLLNAYMVAMMLGGQ